MKCKICDSEFELNKDKRYIVSENISDPIFPIFKDYEAFDCPVCGCQNVVNKLFIKKEFKNKNMKGSDDFVAIPDNELSK